MSYNSMCGGFGSVVTIRPRVVIGACVRAMQGNTLLHCNRVLL